MAKEVDNYQVSLKLVLKNERAEILILNEPLASGRCDLPGGRIDTDEFDVSFEKIIAREIAEELGKISYQMSPFPVAVGRHRIPPAHSFAGLEKKMFLQK